MTTLPTTEENAMKVLLEYRRRKLPAGGALHYSGLYSSAREYGMSAASFREAIEWLTANGYLDIPRTPSDSYVLTKAGHDRAA